MILPELKEMGNKQLYNFSREQTQVFLTSQLGDGCISKTNSNSWIYTSNCKYLEYLEFKKQLIGKGKISLISKNGYSQTPIYTYYGGAYKELELIKQMNLKNILEHLDFLGLALWFYDDCSRHKRDNYYNLNTQKFNLEDHKNVLIPYFNSLNIYPKIRTDNSHKRPLYYLGINKFKGANIISQIMSMFPINCYNYKLWSSETIQKWSKLQEKLKNTDEEFSDRCLALMMNSD